MSKAFRHLWASLIIRNRPVLPSFPDTWLKGTFPLALNLGVAMGLTLGNKLETQLGASLVTKRFNHQCVICQDLSLAQINQKHLLTWSFHLPGSQHRDHQEQSSFNREHKMQMSLQIQQSQSLGLGLSLLWLQKHWVYHERFSNKNLHHTQPFIFISFNMFSMLGTAHVTKTQGMLSGKRPGKTAHQKLNQGPALFIY